jgi:hypothetical protein
MILSYSCCIFAHVVPLIQRKSIKSRKRILRKTTGTGTGIVFSKVTGINVIFFKATKRPMGVAFTSNR